MCCKYQVASEGHVHVSGRRYACTSTEESSRLRASASLRVNGFMDSTGMYTVIMVNLGGVSSIFLILF